MPIKRPTAVLASKSRLSRMKTKAATETKTKKKKEEAPVRAAWFSGGAVVLGAVIALLGGSLSAYLTTIGTNDRSQTDFLRSQRQAAYSQLLADEYRLRQAEEAYILIYGNSSPSGIKFTTSPQVEQAEKNLQDFEANYYRSASLVSIVGSQKASASVDYLSTLHSARDTNIRILRIVEGDNPTGRVVDKKLYTDALTASQAMLGPVQDLTTQAREDLGTSKAK